jgi:hypothetical protein
LWSLLFVLAGALLTLFWAAGPVWAHDPVGDGSQVRAVLDEKPEELEDVTVQVVSVEELGHEFLVENNTGETLEIYDAEGEPILRIGPEGVEAKRSEGAGAEGGAEDTDAEAGWVHKSDEPSWGWFDQRIRDDNISVPEEVRQAQEPADLGEWSIPVRLGEADTEIRGVFRYLPPPKGTYVTRLISEPKNSEINVQMVQGQGRSPAALFLQNRTEGPVTIFGRSGEPAIRIGPEEVQVNVNSPVGREADSNSITDASAADAPSGGDEEVPEWKTVSGGSNFGWQDSRLRPPEGQSRSPENAEDSVPQEVAQWEIPIEIAGEEERLAGVIEWKPFEAAPATDVGKDQSPTPENSGASGSISLRQVAMLGAVTVGPAAVILAILLGPGLYKRYRYRR